MRGRGGVWRGEWELEEMNEVKRRWRGEKRYEKWAVMEGVFKRPNKLVNCINIIKLHKYFMS